MKYGVVAENVVDGPHALLAEDAEQLSLDFFWQRKKWKNDQNVSIRDKNLYNWLKNDAIKKKNYLSPAWRSAALGDVVHDAFEFFDGGLSGSARGGTIKLFSICERRFDAKITKTFVKSTCWCCFYVTFRKK